MSYDYEKIAAERTAERERRSKLWGIDWPGHPNSDKEELTDAEKSLMDEPEKWKLLAVTYDPDADYSYDDLALLQRDDGLHILVRTSGCSCPSPTETWGQIAEGDMTDILKVIQSEIKSWAGEERWKAGPFPEMESIVSKMMIL